MINIQNLGSKESVRIKYKDDVCTESCLQLWVESDWHLIQDGFKETVQKQSSKQSFRKFSLEATVGRSPSKQVFRKNYPTEKHLCWSLFLLKISGLKLCSFMIKILDHRCFPVNIHVAYCKSFENSCFYRTPPVAAFVSLIK